MAREGGREDRTLEGVPTPVVSVPQQHAYTVDDVRLTELDRDPSGLVLGDGVSRVALLPVVVLRVAIEQGPSDLPLDSDGIVLRCGHILLRNWKTTHVLAVSTLRRQQQYAMHTILEINYNCTT